MHKQSTQYFCIIAAAGVGQRMGGNLPKQYLSIAKRTLLEWSLEPFLHSTSISKIVIVLSKDDRWFSELLVARHPKITTAIGGSTRYESVLSGLNALSPIATENDWVIVHDAARPNLSNSDLKKLMDTVGNHPVGGLLGIPSSDSLKEINDNNIIEKNVPREKIWRAFAPQMFRFGLLLSSHQKCLEDKYSITDESSAISYLGYQSLMVLGRSDNFKVSTPEDYEIMKKVLIATENSLEEIA